MFNVNFRALNLSKFDDFALIFLCATNSLMAWLPSDHFKHTHYIRALLFESSYCVFVIRRNNFFLSHMDLWYRLLYDVTHDLLKLNVKGNYH